MHLKLISTFSEYSNIILVGWGTGWHIQPILNLIEELREKKLLWIGGIDSSEEKSAKENDIEFRSIPTLKLSTTKSPKVLLYPFVLLRGIFEARKILCSVMSTESSFSVKTTRHLAQKEEEIRQDFSLHSAPLEMTEKICVFSKGWPGSVAVGIVAWTLWLPLYIHESDTVPWRSNQILGKFATKIFLGFESARKYFDAKKCEIIWQILSPIFSHKSTHGSILWKTDKKHILVICGSQWAKSIFEAITTQFEKSEEYEWIIALGKLNTDMKKSFEQMQDIQATEWLTQEDIAFLLQNTDLAITRGSATTLAEIDLFGIKKIIIPLPYSANNHQYWNARECEKKWDILLEQKDIKKLSELITKTL